MNLSEMVQQFESKKAEARAQLGRMTAQSAAEGREPTATEKAGVQRLIDEAVSIKGRIDRAQGDANMLGAIDALTAGMRSPANGNGGGNRRTLGQQLTEDPRFLEFVRTGGHRVSGVVTSPVFELHAATLTEDSASGGALVIPDTQRRIIELPTRPLVMLDLIAPGSTDSNAVGYMKETVATNAAAAVLEAGTKPESTLNFVGVSDPVKKIATSLPCTEEILEDVPGMRAYIDARLRLFVDIATDDQILNGSGVGANVEGFLARTGLATSIARVAEANADTILDQFFAIWIATNLQPSGVVMNPAQWKTILKTKDTTGQYYGGGPFANPRQPSIWGLPIALSTAMVAGSCLVGAFRDASQWFERSALRVDVTNAHANDFVENKLRFRAERRGALAVYRPAAFGLCTNLN
jgi:HK97 family phage major capsid protein